MNLGKDSVIMPVQAFTDVAIKSDEVCSTEDQVFFFQSYMISFDTFYLLPRIMEKKDTSQLCHAGGR